MMGEIAMVAVGGMYKHYKGGIYEVLGIARHSETQEEMVVYKGDSGLWVRPLPMFTESVLVEGRQVPRFCIVDP